jgi:hypothetical protein
MHHLALLNHPRVYERLHAWLEAEARPAALPALPALPPPS